MRLDPITLTCRKDVRSGTGAIPLFNRNGTQSKFDIHRSKRVVADSTNLPLHLLTSGCGRFPVKLDDHSEVVPLLPIPNRTVKRLSADDSAGSRVKVGHCQAINKKALVDRRGLFSFVRTAWAQSWRCKSSRELTTASEVKRNGVRETERGKEAWSANRESRNTRRIRAGTE